MSMNVDEQILRRIIHLSGSGLVCDGCSWCEKIYDIMNRILIVNKALKKKSKKRNIKKRKQRKETEQWVKDHI
jgi:hypothetical protein